MAEVANRPSYEQVERKVEVMDTPYDQWIASQGIDIVRGFFVEDLYNVPLKWWDRIGGTGNSGGNPAAYSPTSTRSIRQCDANRGTRDRGHSQAVAIHSRCVSCKTEIYPSDGGYVQSMQKPRIEDGTIAWARTSHPCNSIARQFLKLPLSKPRNSSDPGDEDRLILNWIPNPSKKHNHSFTCSLR